mmetsp:Transcript_2710/g.4727  ORF Transcript_2710/g.4727 Transcript_2710/m.4727 type:complete len:99 (+) Transcript_2710:939-1235(+)
MQLHRTEEMSVERSAAEELLRNMSPSIVWAAAPELELLAARREVARQCGVLPHVQKGPASKKPTVVGAVPTTPCVRRDSRSGAWEEESSLRTGGLVVL